MSDHLILGEDGQIHRGQVWDRMRGTQTKTNCGAPGLRGMSEEQTGRLNPERCCDGCFEYSCPTSMGEDEVCGQPVTGTVHRSYRGQARLIRYCAEHLDHGVMLAEYDLPPNFGTED